jgi:RimJ/RimL family protein N-acetyltransferase
MARRRFEYVLELKSFSSPAAPDPFAEATWRNPSAADKQILADLMLASYRGSIDDDGETIEDAMKEVESYYSGLLNQSWLQYSWLIFLDNELACACLVDFWIERNVPLVAFIMTAPRWKGKHLATAALLCSLQKLVDKNHTEVRAVITEGNIPSEKIFTRIGFKRLSSD